jgi:hypothetical protein
MDSHATGVGANQHYVAGRGGYRLYLYVSPLGKWWPAYVHLMLAWQLCAACLCMLWRTASAAHTGPCIASLAWQHYITASCMFQNVVASALLQHKLNGEQDVHCN